MVYKTVYECDCCGSKFDGPTYDNGISMGLIFDEIIEPYKENLERDFNSGTKRLYCYCKEDIEDDELYVKLSDVESMISSIL